MAVARWTVCVWGGEAALTLGGLYNLRNSNNPATAKAAIDLGATAMASYHFYISRLPVTLRYQVSLPVIGTFFSPEFGQSYYEMFGIGNCSGSSISEHGITGSMCGIIFRSIFMWESGHYVWGIVK